MGTRLAVHLERAVVHPHPVAGDGRHPLEEHDAGVRRGEHHHVAARGAAEPGDVAGHEREVDAVGELADQDVVLELDRRQHRSGGDHVVVGERGARDERDRDRREDGSARGGGSGLGKRGSACRSKPRRGGIFQ